MQLFESEKSFEIIFFAAFSVFIFVFFFALLSMNGLVLGNDPAVHIERTHLFLKTGRIPLGTISLYPPLYHILLATLMAFTGAASIEQTIFLIKTLTAIINWLIIFSIYLFGTKFFGKKIGVFASILVLFLFPFYELNFWGGYPTLLSLSLMVLLFLYLSIEMKAFTHEFLIFLFAFSVVFSHQLTAFVAFLIMAPFVIIAVAKFKGRSSKALIAAIIGGALAFFLYYSPTIIPHLNDILVIHILADIGLMLYQIPSVTFQAFAVNFGFILFFALIGLFLTFRYRRKKKAWRYLLLVSSFFVPLLLSQTYFFGLYLPYQRFVYYLLPSLAIFGAVCFSYIVDFVISLYHSSKLRSFNLKMATALLVILLSALFIFRSGVVYEKIMESSVYYSTSDIKAYDAGLWLRDNYPDDATVVVTQTPGSWFGLFSSKPTIAATDIASGRNDLAETILDLAYEIENPLCLIRAYDSWREISEEKYVSINHVWNRVSFSSEEGNFITYCVDGAYKKTALLNFNREIAFEDNISQKKFIIYYFNSEIIITQTIVVCNDSYPINVTWKLSPIGSQIRNVTLYLSVFFDLRFSFEKTYVPSVLNWENPWDRASSSEGNDWVVVNFSRSTLTDKYFGFYDEREKVTFTLNFKDLPDWGNVGALASRQIDAIRFQYNFGTINVNQTAFFTYQVLTFSKSSYPEVQQQSELRNLFEIKPLKTFEVKSRNYRDLLNEKAVRFIVYDKNQLNIKIVNCNLLELVYSNNRYAIFRVKSNP